MISPVSPGPSSSPVSGSTILTSILGRTNSYKYDYYITMYVGGSLKLFDMYVDEPIKSNDVFGKETLYGFNQIMNKLKISDYDYIKHLEFRRYKGLFLGNIYTPFRRYYSDFGFKGIIILTFIFSIIINSFYLKVKNKMYTNNNKDIWILLYSLIVYTLFLYSIDDQFFTVVCSFTYMTMFAVVLFIYLIYKRRFESSSDVK